MERVLFLSFAPKKKATLFLSMVDVCFTLKRLVFSTTARGEFRPRQTRQLPRAVDLKGRLLNCQSY